MPRLRLLADLATAQASGISGADADGNPIFDVAPGDLVPVRLDATGWAGADSVTGAAWDASDGAVLSARVLSGPVASCQVFLPESGARRAYRVDSTLTLSSGPIRKTTMWLRAG